MDTMTTDELLASDPDFAAVCDARRDEAIAHMEATAQLSREDRCAALMGAVVSGDARAFDDLYRTLAPRIRGYLRSLCRNEHTAEDLTQTTFLKIHRARHTYRLGAAVAPWAFTIARRVWLDHRRSAARRHEFLTPDGAPLDVEAPADDEPAWTDAAALALEALSDLGADQRAAVTALHLEGLSLREAAARQGCSEGALKVRAHRGYVAMRASLS